MEPLEINGPVVLIASNRVRSPLLEVVAEACATARVSFTLWDSERPLDLTRPPVAVVSVLGPGERRISDALARLMTHDCPGLPLVLLSSDEMVRPTVSLHDGRVTLLSGPHTADRISARLRIVLADQSGIASHATIPFGVGSTARTHVSERSTPSLYIGSVSSSLTHDLREHAPLVEVDENGAVTALLTISAATSHEIIGRATEMIVGDDPDDEKETQLLNLIGASMALIHCAPSLEWSSHWPDPTFGLVLASSNRLPSIWSFSNALGRDDGTFVRAQGVSSDVLIALWGFPWESCGIRAERLLEAAQVGGPQVLDLLVERLNASEHPASALVLEFR